MNSLEARYVRARGPLSRQVAEDTVMFHPSRGEYFALDAVGTRIWELLEEPRSVGDLCQTLVAEFDVDPGTCTRDVAALVAQLREAELIEENP